jgi:hypothetical protein
MKTLEQAARAYCEQRALIATVQVRIGKRWKCSRSGSDVIGETCLDKYELRGADVLPARRFYEATPDEQAEFCVDCSKFGALVEQSHRLKASLAGLMRSMLGAYRREKS